MAAERVGGLDPDIAGADDDGAPRPTFAEEAAHALGVLEGVQA